MPEFNPNDDLDSQEKADAYINWCADQFMRLSQGPRRTYRTAVRCAAWLFVVASAQLHLDEAVTEDREALLEQLGKYQQLGRAIERQVQHFPVEQWLVLRSSLDCWQPVGVWAPSLLIAARCAVGARILIETYPMVDLWDLGCEDVWTLLEGGREALAAINGADELDFADYAVRPNEFVIGQFTWQRAHNLVRGAGLRVDLGNN